MWSFNRISATALHAFAAAARTGSFIGAGRALNLSHSAISRQIRQMEDRLGVSLFERTGRRVVLTPSGARLAEGIERGFAEIERALSLVRDPVEPRTLNVAADADVAQLWLAPRLSDFAARHPDWRIRLAAFTDLEDLPNDTADCAIAWGGGEWTVPVFEPLFANVVFVACRPEMTRGANAITGPGDLARHRLIHDRDIDWWRRFFVAGEVGLDHWRDGPIYNQTVLCLDAAVRGEGVTLGDEVTTRPYLERGDLVIPFDLKLPGSAAYYLLRPNEPMRDGVRLFRDWLFEQADEHRRWFATFWAQQ